MRMLLRQASRASVRRGAERPIDFHRRLPGYNRSPLLDLPHVADKLGVAKVYVKDETSRFGLPSFKILGASWATYAALRERLGPLPEGDLTYDRMSAWAAPLRPLTLIAATDGNHGRAVARVARWFGLDARIFVPGFVSPERCQAIRNEGAELTVIDGVYDASVDAALEAACEDRTLLVTDTARAVSDVMPRLVMGGYATAFAEIDEELKGTARRRLDLVAVQAGVGGLASSCANWAVGRRAGKPTRVVVVEPEPAACVMAGLAAGEPVTVSGAEISDMACLQCGTMSVTAFAGLEAGVSACLAIEDIWSTMAVEELRAGGLDTGPSGAAGLAGLMAGLSGPFARPLADHLRLDADARVLVVATEAATAAAHVEAEEMAFA